MAAQGPGLVQVVTPGDLDALRAEFDGRIARLDERLRKVEGKPPVPPPPPPAGRWLSGAGTYDPYAFGDWRGRPLDVWNTWNTFDTWPEMRGIPSVRRYFTGTGQAPFNRRFPGRMDFAQPLWAKSEDADVTAKGDNKAHFQAIAKALADAGHGNAFVRLGWEHTGDWFWWHVSDANLGAWIGGFQRVHDIFKAVSEQFVIVWCPNKSSNFGFDARRSYPGGDYCDVVGVDWYNMWPASHSPAEWDAQFMRVDSKGAPVGLGAWASYARSVGKPLALPENGLDAGPGFNTANGSGDDPHYFTELHAFCSGPGNNVAYECVFNLRGENFQVQPPARFPRASAEYLRLWRP